MRRDPSEPIRLHLQRGFYTRRRSRAANGLGAGHPVRGHRTSGDQRSSCDLWPSVSVARYRVNLDAIDAVGVPALLDALGRGQVIVVDEIGPMEILLPRFRDAVLNLLDSDAAIVGAIVLRPQPFADRVKAHPRVTVRHITRDNRNDLPAQILSKLAHCGPPGLILAHPPEESDPQETIGPFLSHPNTEPLRRLDLGLAHPGIAFSPHAWG